MPVDSSKTKIADGTPILVPTGQYSATPPLPLDRQSLVVGSKAGCHIRLTSSSVSQTHALIVVSRDGVLVRDLASRTGVIVNAAPVREHFLQDGDELQIGRFTFKFSLNGAKRRQPSALIPIEIRSPLLKPPYRNLGHVVSIGRRPGSDITFSHEAVSTAHALLFFSENRWHLRDLESRTGTKVNGERVHRTDITLGDVIRIAHTDFRVAPASIEEEAEPTPETTDVVSEASTVAPAVETGVAATIVDSSLPVAAVTEAPVPETTPSAPAEVEADAGFDVALPGPAPVHFASPHPQPQAPSSLDLQELELLPVEEPTVTASTGEHADLHEAPSTVRAETAQAEPTSLQAEPVEAEPTSVHAEAASAPAVDDGGSSEVAPVEITPVVSETPAAPLVPAAAPIDETVVAEPQPTQSVFDADAMQELETAADIASTTAAPEPASEFDHEPPALGTAATVHPEVAQPTPYTVEHTQPVTEPIAVTASPVAAETITEGSDSIVEEPIAAPDEAKSSVDEQAASIAPPEAEVAELVAEAPVLASPDVQPEAASPARVDEAAEAVAEAPVPHEVPAVEHAAVIAPEVSAAEATTPAAAAPVLDSPEADSVIGEAAASALAVSATEAIASVHEIVSPAEPTNEAETTGESQTSHISITPTPTPPDLSATTHEAVLPLDLAEEAIAAAPVAGPASPSEIAPEPAAEVEHEAESAEPLAHEIEPVVAESLAPLAEATIRTSEVPPALEEAHASIADASESRAPDADLTPGPTSPSPEATPPSMATTAPPLESALTAPEADSAPPAISTETVAATTHAEIAPSAPEVTQSDSPHVWPVAGSIAETATTPAAAPVAAESLIAPALGVAAASTLVVAATEAIASVHHAVEAPLPVVTADDAPADTTVIEAPAGGEGDLSHASTTPAPSPSDISATTHEGVLPVELAEEPTPVASAETEPEAVEAEITAESAPATKAAAESEPAPANESAPASESTPALEIASTELHEPSTSEPIVASPSDDSFFEAFIASELPPSADKSNPVDGEIEATFTSAGLESIVPATGDATGELLDAALLPLPDAIDIEGVNPPSAPDQILPDHMRLDLIEAPVSEFAPVREEVGEFTPWHQPTDPSLEIPSTPAVEAEIPASDAAAQVATEVHAIDTAAVAESAATETMASEASTDAASAIEASAGASTADELPVADVPTTAPADSSVTATTHADVVTPELTAAEVDFAGPQIAANEAIATEGSAAEIPSGPEASLEALPDQVHADPQAIAAPSDDAMATSEGHAVAPEAIAPELVAADVVPEAIAPEIAATQAPALEAVAPEALAPEIVAPEVAAPEVATPEAVAGEVVAPEAVEPEAVSTDSVSVEAATVETVSTDVPVGDSPSAAPEVTAEASSEVAAVAPEAETPAVEITETIPPTAPAAFAAEAAEQSVSLLESASLPESTEPVSTGDLPSAPPESATSPGSPVPSESHSHGVTGAAVGEAAAAGGVGALIGIAGLAAAVTAHESAVSAAITSVTATTHLADGAASLLGSAAAEAPSAPPVASEVPPASVLIESVTPPVEAVTPPAETLAPSAEPLAPSGETLAPPAEPLAPSGETLAPSVAPIDPSAIAATTAVDAATPVETVTTAALEPMPELAEPTLEVIEPAPPLLEATSNAASPSAEPTDDSGPTPGGVVVSAMPAVIGSGVHDAVDVSITSRILEPDLAESSEPIPVAELEHVDFSTLNLDERVHAMDADAIISSPIETKAIVIAPEALPETRDFHEATEVSGTPDVLEGQIRFDTPFEQITTSPPGTPSLNDLLSLEARPEDFAAMDDVFDAEVEPVAHAQTVTFSDPIQVPPATTDTSTTQTSATIEPSTDPARVDYLEGETASDAPAATTDAPVMADAPAAPASATETPAPVGDVAATTSAGAVVPTEDQSPAAMEPPTPAAPIPAPSPTAPPTAPRPRRFTFEPLSLNDDFFAQADKRFVEAASKTPAGGKGPVPPAPDAPTGAGQSTVSLVPDPKAGLGVGGAVAAAGEAGALGVAAVTATGVAAASAAGAAAAGASAAAADAAAIAAAGTAATVAAGVVSGLAGAAGSAIGGAGSMIGAAAKALKAEFDPFAPVEAASNFVGGLPIQLPKDQGPPQTFGRVSVRFDTDIPKPVIKAAPIPGTEVALPEAPSTLPGVTPPGAVRETEPIQPRTQVAKNFPPVPKARKSGRTRSPFANEPVDQTGQVIPASDDIPITGSPFLPQEESDVVTDMASIPGAGVFSGITMPPVQPTNVFGGGELPAANDAVFGGQRLTRADDYVLPDSADYLKTHQLEPIDDFSQNDFWDHTDEDQPEVPLRPVHTDLAPPIPPIASLYGDDDPAVTQTPTAGPQGAAIDAEPVEPVTLTGSLLGNAVGPEHVATTTSGLVGTDEPTPLTDLPEINEKAWGSPESLKIEDEQSFQRRAQARIDDLTGDDQEDGELPFEETPAPELPVGDYDVPGAYRQRPATVWLPSAPPTPPAPVSLRRRHRHLIPALMTAMIVSIGLAGCGIWFLYPTRSTVEGRLSFRNTLYLSQQARNDLEGQQKTFLSQPDTLHIAERELISAHPDETLDPAVYSRIAHSVVLGKASAAGDANDLIFLVNGSDATTDAHALAAILSALYARNNEITDNVARLAEEVDGWKHQISQAQDDIDDLDRRIRNASAIVKAAQDVQAHMPDARDAEVQYKAAWMTLSKDQQMLDSVNYRLLPPADAATRPSEDPQLADLNQRIGILAQHIAELQNSSAGTSEAAAKTALATAQTQLGQQIDAAKAALQDHPDFVASIDAERDLLQETQRLTDQLVQRRQDWQEQLVDLKRFIEDDARQRQQAKYLNDPQLKQINDELESLQHKLGAADAVGLSEVEQDDLRKQIADLQAQQTDRQEALTSNDDYGDIRGHVDALIKSGQAQLREDRKIIDERLQTMQVSLAAAPPTSDLSPAQRQTLDELNQRVTTLSSAQTAYDDAVAAADPDAESIPSLQKELADLRQQAQTRQTLIAQVNQVLTPEMRATLEGEKTRLTAQLTIDQQKADDALTAFNQVSVAVEDADRKIKEARDADPELAQLEAQRDYRVQDLQRTRHELEETQLQQANVLDVRPPDESSVKIFSDNNNQKLKYMFGSAVSLVALFGLLTVIAAQPGREVHAPPPRGPQSTPPSDNGGPSAEPVAATATSAGGTKLPADPFGIRSADVPSLDHPSIDGDEIDDALPA